MAITKTRIKRRDGKKGVRVKVAPNSIPQHGFMQSEAAYLAFFSGFGGGKTWAGATKAVRNALFRFRGRNGLVVAPTFGDLETFVIPELLQRFADVGIDIQYKASPPPYLWFYLQVNGKKKKIYIYLRSGAHPEAIAGFEVAWVWIDEAARIHRGKNPLRDVKTQCIARMRGVGLKEKQLFITTTHEGELTWVAQDWIGEEPKVDHVHFRGTTYDNPLMRDYADGLMKQYDKKLVRQYVQGEAVTIGGVQVYWGFNDAVWPAGNMDKSIRVDWHLPLMLTMDFNSRPGMHGLICQHHPAADEIWIIDEIHGQGMHVPGLVASYARKVGRKGKRLVTEIYGDPTSHARDSAIGATGYSWVFSAMQAHELPYVDMSSRSSPTVADRLISMNSAFEDGVGRRHIRIHPRCTRLIRDLHTVSYDDYGRVDKTQERNGFVHISDAAGYLLHRVRPINRASIKSLLTRRAS